MGFASKQDAERVMVELNQRMADYGLSLHPEKTRLVPFRSSRPGGIRRQRAGDIRPVGLHAGLAANAQGTVGCGHEDTQGKAKEGAQSSRRTLSTPSARLAQGAARRAHQADRRTPQLLDDPSWPTWQAASIIWHEVMHQYGYTRGDNYDNTSAKAACGGASNVAFDFQSNTMPYPVDNCLGGVLTESGRT
jgi:hypothetical protein